MHSHYHLRSSGNGYNRLELIMVNNVSHLRRPEECAMILSIPVLATTINSATTHRFIIRVIYDNPIEVINIWL